MKRFELELEHQYKGKFVGRHRFSGRSRVIVFGQNRDADIRLLGDDVSGIHAYLEFQDGAWTFSDAGSQNGTWVQKSHINSCEIKEETLVTIGGHQLKFTPKVIEKEIFAPDYFKNGDTTGTKNYHQVIVRKHDVTVRSELLPENEAFTFTFAGKDHRLPAPNGAEVKEISFEPFKIIQRIVKSNDVVMSPGMFFSGLNSPEMRAPFMAAFILLGLLGALILAIPEKPKDEMNEIKADNKYTRMVFDAELMKKKKAQAKEMRKTIQASAPKNSAPKNTLSTPARNKATAPKVVSQLKLEGLNSLLGKIAKRANSKGPTIVGFGKTADDSRTGHSTVAAVGSLQGVATGAAGNASTYKVDGVGTLGKGGGSGRAVAGIGGLAAGGAGSGTVGILDEETEIDGGLDKEVIARVIAGYLGEIRYCYERQLSAEPDIYGKVQVKFTIDASGAVAEHRIGNSTLKSAMVEGCILRRLARWKFPKPKGGTHVLVTYPFMFKSTN